MEDLQISLGQCSAVCDGSTFPSVYPGCDLFSDVKGYASWEAHGVTWYVTNRDVLFESVIDVFGERVSPQRFVISGSYDLTFVRFLGQLGYDQTGSAEIAVIRFSADPAGLVGLLPTGVYDLVAAGLIEESDILYRDDFTDATSFAMEFSFEVDVTDINDGQLFLFATAQGEVPEPEQWMMLAAGIACLMGLHCRREKMRILNRGPAA